MMRALTGWLAAPTLFVSVALGGPIDPPAGPVAPTMKTLVQVEPRRPVQSLAGSEFSMFVISEPGSYYLTGDIVRAGGKRGIEIASSNVTLDLSGFSVVGASGNPSFNVGIAVSGPHRNLVVRNGTLRGWGYAMHGSNVYRCLIEDLAILDSTAGGLEIGSLHNSIVRNVRAASDSPTELGILVGDNCVVEGCAVEGPSSSGIAGGTNCTVTRCSVRGAGRGINLYQDGVVAECSVRGVETGIQITRGGGIIEGCSVSSCSEAGVTISAGVSVLNNSIRLCPEGINTSAAHLGGSRIEGNSLLGNAVALRIDSTGNTIVRNVITGSTSAAMQVVPGNAVGVTQASPVGAGAWDNIVF